MPNKKVKVKYLKTYDFKIALVTGVYGGLGTNGLINANFFIDRVVIPNSQEFEIDDSGKQVTAAIDDKDCDVVREVQFGTFMDINTMKIFHDWLGKKIIEYDQLFPKVKK